MYIPTTTGAPSTTMIAIGEGYVPKSTGRVKIAVDRRGTHGMKSSQRLVTVMMGLMMRVAR